MSVLWPAVSSVSAVRVIGGTGCQDGCVEVLSSRILLRPADLGQSQHFYKDVLGLAIYREFGSPADPGVVFFLGSGFLESLRALSRRCRALDDDLAPGTGHQC